VVIKLIVDDEVDTFFKRTYLSISSCRRCMFNLSETTSSEGGCDWIVGGVLRCFGALWLTCLEVCRLLKRRYVDCVHLIWINVVLVGKRKDSLDTGLGPSTAWIGLEIPSCHVIYVSKGTEGVTLIEHSPEPVTSSQPTRSRLTTSAP